MPCWPQSFLAELRAFVENLDQTQTTTLVVGVATATSFAARRGEEVDPNQEMIGMGAANIAAGFFQGFAVSTSGSRTAVAEQSEPRAR